MKQYFVQMARHLDEVREIIYEGRLDDTVARTMKRQDADQDGFLNEDEFYNRQTPVLQNKPQNIEL